MSDEIEEARISVPLFFPSLNKLLMLVLMVIHMCEPNLSVSKSIFRRPQILVYGFTYSLFDIVLSYGFNKSLNCSKSPHLISKILEIKLGQ